MGLAHLLGDTASDLGDLGAEGLLEVAEAAAERVDGAAGAERVVQLNREQSDRRGEEHGHDDTDHHHC